MALTWARKGIGALLVLVVGGGVSFALFMGKPRPEAELPVDVTMPVVDVVVAAPTVRALAVETQGTVRPLREIKLVSQVGGRVEYVSPRFAQGGFFAADEALVKVEDIDYQFVIARAESQVAAAQQRVAEEEGRALQAQREWRDLGSEQGNALFLRKPQLASAQAALKASEADLAAAELDLSRTTISAPFNGRISEKSVDIGQFVAPGTVLATVYDTDVVQVRLPLTDRQVALLDLPLNYDNVTPDAVSGAHVRLRTQFANREWEWEGRLVRTDASIDEDSRVVYAVAEIEKPFAREPGSERPPLSPGLFVSATISGRQLPQVVELPRSALRSNGSVMIVGSDQRARPRPVRVLQSTTNSIWVQGLNGDDRVIVRAPRLILSGMEVSVNVAELGGRLSVMAGPIRWFVHNPIAANLLMVFLLVGGAMAIPALDKEFFPDFELNIVSVTMPYRGAGPSEVEQQICKRIEEAVHDLNGVKEIRSSARQGMGKVLIEAEVGYDSQRLSAEVRSRVDAITTFPAEAERPVVTELAHRHHMAVVTLAGDIGERDLKELGEELRDDLSTQPHVSVVELVSPRPYEVSVEVSEYTLRRYGLTFADVVNAIRGSSLNLPAGAIKTSDGDIQLQTRGQAYNRQDFQSIPLLSRRDGTQLVVGDVATVLDGFEDLDVRKSFNDKPSHDLHVFVTSNPNTLSTSEVLHTWVEQTRKLLPPGVELALWQDTADLFKGRANTLVKNGIGGLVLVFLLLMLFLRPLLALWVCVGIAVAFMGTFLLLPYAGVSLNMISLLAFLLILGIVVDDAIIVGEAIYSHQTAGEVAHEGAVNGTRAVLKPVMYAVISTMIFVAPMLILPGEMASAGIPIPVVIILALTFSLIECMLILPSHLAHMKPLQPSKVQLFRRLEHVRLKFADGMINFARDVYRPFLARCLDANLLVAAIFIVALFFSLALYGGGWLRSAFFPAITADFTFAEISLSEGGAFKETLRVLQQVESAALQVKSEYNSDPRFAGTGPVIGHIDSRGKSNEIEVYINVPSSAVDIKEVTERWRELVGDLGPVENMHMDYTFNDRGKPITLVMASPSLDDLRAVSVRLSEVLETYPGVYNINDTLQSPREEIELQLKPAAENLSVTLADLARQVREAFYGAEAQRIPRPREDVRVMVRYPQRERLSVENLNDMRVRTPGGDEVPFDTVAEVHYQPGYLTIDRLDRKRTLKITADVLAGTVDPRVVVNEIVANELPALQERYEGLTLDLDGELQEEAQFLGAMLTYMGLAMLIVYALMAIPFRSYFQPLLVLTAVPFGVMGAIFGHAIFDWQISMFSLLGVIAAAGVVVNDNLVLIDRINQLRDRGHGVVEALLQGGQDRFRPIILTSLTTFVGLMPIMAETSVQAQFLIPMVISLAFGVLFATGVTLLLVPCLYLFGEQVSAHLLHRRQSLPDVIDEV